MAPQIGVSVVGRQICDYPFTGIDAGAKIRSPSTAATFSKGSPLNDEAFAKVLTVSDTDVECAAGWDERFQWRPENRKREMIFDSMRR